MKSDRKSPAAAADLLLGARSVNEWCADYGIGRSTFFVMKRAGTAPATIYANGKMLITHRASAEWEVQAAERNRADQSDTQPA